MRRNLLLVLCLDFISLGSSILWEAGGRLLIFIAYLAAVHYLVAVVFAFVRPNQKLQFVFLQKSLRDIRAEVCARAPQSIRAASLVVLRIAP